MKTTLQKSITAGINLRGTIHAGKSAEELRRDNPELARAWAGFIESNKEQLVKEIADKLNPNAGIAPAYPSGRWTS